MKRPIIVLCIVACIIGICVYARYRVDEARERIFAYAEEIFTHIEKEDASKVQQTVGELREYWRGEQRYLVLFFRHAELDEISRAVSKLGAHAAFEEYNDLSAELGVILWQIDHIWESDRAKPGSIMALSALLTIAFSPS